MLLVNKNIGTQVFIVTVTENATFADPELKMKLHSNYTNEDFEVDLGGNFSQHTQRYDEFHVATSGFTMSDGIYAYEIMDQTEAVLERGVLKVFTPGTTEEEFTVDAPAEEADDFLTYK